MDFKERVEAIRGTMSPKFDEVQWLCREVLAQDEMLAHYRNITMGQLEKIRQQEELISDFLKETLQLEATIRKLSEAL